MSPFSPEILWWITAIDLPALGGLFWLIWRTRREHEQAIADTRAALADFKLEVAKSYAAIGDVREVEKRLVSHLLRIESKLDATAMKTEALRAKESRNPE
ncbi:MAG: hypothetical protein KDJ15_03330 [Alphaproteobacteria bacterium]|nr:hypothetical protein [Alphaproteobacteria bacterium]